MHIEIKKISGKWLINGNTYDKLNAEEKDFFDQFILYMREQYELENNQKKT